MTTETTGREWGVQIFCPPNIATKAEIEAIGGPPLMGGNPVDVLALTSVDTEVWGGSRPANVWEVNIWGMSKEEVEARAAKLSAFLADKAGE